MIHYHDWEWFTGDNIPTGQVQIWIDGLPRGVAETSLYDEANEIFWDSSIVAFRRVKVVVRGEVVMYGRILHHGWNYNTYEELIDTHRITLPTIDGEILCGETVWYNGTTLKVEVIEKAKP